MIWLSGGFEKIVDHDRAPVKKKSASVLNLKTTHS